MGPPAEPGARRAPFARRRTTRSRASKAWSIGRLALAASPSRPQDLCPMRGLSSSMLRDLARQPWRTTLTVSGIAIGIFALVVLGALAEHFRAIVADAKDYVRGTIRLATKTNKDGENPG